MTRTADPLVFVCPHCGRVWDANGLSTARPAGMSVQLDLFDATPAVGADAWWIRSSFDEWGNRCLRDLAERAARLYPGGFMGVVHEEIVARGYATATPDGYFEPPATLKPREAKVWRKTAAECPVSLYRITDAGRTALLAAGLATRPIADGGAVQRTATNTTGGK